MPHNEIFVSFQTWLERMQREHGPDFRQDDTTRAKQKLLERRVGCALGEFPDIRQDSIFVVGSNHV